MYTNEKATSLTVPTIGETPAPQPENFHFEQRVVGEGLGHAVRFSVFLMWLGHMFNAFSTYYSPDHMFGSFLTSSAISLGNTFLWEGFVAFRLVLIIVLFNVFYPRARQAVLKSMAAELLISTTFPHALAAGIEHWLPISGPLFHVFIPGALSVWIIHSTLREKFFRNPSLTVRWATFVVLCWLPLLVYHRDWSKISLVIPEMLVNLLQ
jgi:hypothetical protein